MFSPDNNEEDDILIIKTPEGLKPVIKNIYFEYNKADLNIKALYDLDKVIKILDKYSAYKVIIEGHTDSIGSEGFNLKLSARRAEAVHNYLIKNGVNEKRLLIKEYGFSKPLVSNINPDGTDNPEGRTKNRRFELLLILDK